MSKLSKQILNQTFSRLMTLDAGAIDTENLTVPASLSSETPAKQFFGTEKLIHTKAAIDMERAGSDNGLPLLLGHQDGTLIGRVKNIKLKNKRLSGILHFSPNSEAARAAWADVQDGFLTDISIRYNIESVRETITDDRKELIEITRWKPTEASVVSVPADSTVGINRSDQNEVIPMSKKVPIPAQPAAPLTVASFRAAQDESKKVGLAEGTTAERVRVSDINTAFDMHSQRDGVDALRSACIADGTGASRAGKLLLEYLAGDDIEPTGTSQRQAPGNHGQRVDLIADASDKWIEGATLALMVRAQMISDPKEAEKAREGNEFNGMNLIDMARHYLVHQGQSMAGLSRRDIAGQAFTRAGGQHGTSDFSNVLENVANKSMLIGFTEAGETWQRWARKGSLSDFKVASRVNISSFSDLEKVLESGEYKEGHLSDLKETIQLAKFGKLFTISREAIINDDLAVFSRTPNGMGRAANRKVGDLAYAVLTSNGTLNQDSTAIFHTDHSNIGTAGVITEATLDEFGKLMAAQVSPIPATGETGATLNYSPKYLLVPRALLMAATKVVRSATAPAGATAGDLTVNTVQDAFEVIWDSRLDADDADQYYGLADQAIADTVEVAFLDGVETPFLDSENGFTQDGVKFKVRIECAAAAMDFRGMVRNAGP